MRYLIAVMAMIVLAAPGAFANTEAGSHCFAPAIHTCAAAPASDDVFLFVHDPACKDQIGYENCKWDADNRWVICMRGALIPSHFSRAWKETQCHVAAKHRKDSCQWHYCDRRSAPPLPQLQ